MPTSWPQSESLTEFVFSFIDRSSQTVTIFELYPRQYGLVLLYGQTNRVKKISGVKIIAFIIDHILWGNINE
jgi:hypothetical protein